TGTIAGGPSGASIGTTQSITVNPTATTTYWLTVSGPNCTPAPCPHTVTVNPNPSASVNSPTICSGSTATLMATASGIGTLSYQWYTGSSCDDANKIDGATGSSYTTGSLTASATYSVKVTDTTTDTACTTCASGTVTVNANPSVSVDSKTICAGGSATL